MLLGCLIRKATFAFPLCPGMEGCNSESKIIFLLIVAVLTTQNISTNSARCVLQLHLSVVYLWNYRFWNWNMLVYSIMDSFYWSCPATQKWMQGSRYWNWWSSTVSSQLGGGKHVLGIYIFFYTYSVSLQCRICRQSWKKMVIDI